MVVVGLQNHLRENELMSLVWYYLKSTLSGLRKFLAIESPLKMMKNAFYFTSKAVFVF